MSVRSYAETRTCPECGGTYSPTSVWGTSARRVALFECDWCEVRNFAAVTLDSDTTQAEIPPKTEQVRKQHQARYPTELTVLSVLANIPAGFPEEEVKAYLDQTATIHVTTPGGFSESTATELVTKLREPTIEVSYNDGEILISQFGGGIAPNGGGTSLETVTEPTAVETNTAQVGVSEPTRSQTA